MRGAGAAQLEDLILDACLLGAASPASLLAESPTPPKPAALALAIDNLSTLQAIEYASPPHGRQGGGLGGWCGNQNAESLRLTPLGHHLGRLPLDPRLGKMLLLASLTGCLDPLLTVGAALSAGARSVFHSPHERKAEASTAHRKAFGGSRSDLIAISAAYDGWLAARAEGKERAHCEPHLLACLPAYLPTCLPTYLPTYLPAYLPTYLPTYLLRSAPIASPTF